MEEINMANMKSIEDKLVITGTLELKTGMHIGKSNDFAPIGAVDSVVITDPMTSTPIIPGSSLKGKLRTMLAKLETNDGKPGILKPHNADSDTIKSLFGASEPVMEARLQFYDLFLINADEIRAKDTDLLYTEIKFENTISRTTAVANPRQLERVPAGAKFGLKLVYNVEDQTEIEKDFKLLSDGLKMLQLDYIGGSGTRGYGKVNFYDFKVESKGLTSTKIDSTKAEELLKESENYAI